MRSTSVRAVGAALSRVDGRRRSLETSPDFCAPTSGLTDITVGGFIRPSDCHDNPEAVDVRVSLRLDGELLDGELTLLPSDRDGALASWGSPDHWVSGALLARIEKAFPEPDALRDALREIEHAVGEAVR
jgi:hypothetical protein